MYVAIMSVERLKVGDTVAIGALAWGRDWAEAAYPDTWRKQMVEGTVLEKRSDGTWRCNFNEESESEQGCFKRKALTFISRPETAATVPKKRKLSPGKSGTAPSKSVNTSDEDGEERREESLDDENAATEDPMRDALEKAVDSSDEEGAHRQIDEEGGDDTLLQPSQKKKRGRPKGSKNGLKAEGAETEGAGEGPGLVERAVPGGPKPGTKRALAMERAASGEPKRPMNAYMHFASEARAGMKAANPDAGAGALSTLMSAKWREMDDAEKQPYVAKAEAQKAEYEEAMAAFIAANGETVKQKARREKSEASGEQASPKREKKKREGGGGGASHSVSVMKVVEQMRALKELKAEAAVKLAKVRKNQAKLAAKRLEVGPPTAEPAQLELIGKMDAYETQLEAEHTRLATELSDIKAQTKALVARFDELEQQGEERKAAGLEAKKRKEAKAEAKAEVKAEATGGLVAEEEVAEEVGNEKRPEAAVAAAAEEEEKTAAGAGVAEPEEVEEDEEDEEAEAVEGAQEEAAEEAAPEDGAEASPAGEGKVPMGPE